MIDTDEYERILKDDDGRNNVFALDLLAEVKRLRENIKGYIAIWDYLDPKGYAWKEEEFVTLLKEHGFDTGDEEE